MGNIFTDFGGWVTSGLGWAGNFVEQGVGKFGEQSQIAIGTLTGGLFSPPAYTRAEYESQAVGIANQINVLNANQNVQNQQTANQISVLNADITAQTSQIANLQTELQGYEKYFQVTGSTIYPTLGSAGGTVSYPNPSEIVISNPSPVPMPSGNGVNLGGYLELGIIAVVVAIGGYAAFKYVGRSGKRR